MTTAEKNSRSSTAWAAATQQARENLEARAEQQHCPRCGSAQYQQSVSGNILRGSCFSCFLTKKAVL